MSLERAGDMLKTKRIQAAALWLTALSALSLVSCSTSPTGRHRVDLVSEDQMKQMGDQAWTETRKKYKESTDAATKAFVDKVARRIIAAGPLADQKWDVVVFDSKEINAFALPGGHIGVFSGILPICQDEAGLATVLGHETSHVIADHSAERATDESITQGALSALGAAGVSNTVMGVLGLGSQVGVLLPFSRAQESEADQMGFMLMAKAGYDPNEAIAFWQRMVQSAGGEPPAFLSDHPASSDRIAKLQSLLPEAQNEYAKASQKSGGGDRAPASAARH